MNQCWSEFLYVPDWREYASDKNSLKIQLWQLQFKYILKDNLQRNGRNQGLSMNLDQPLFVYKYGVIAGYKNQCLTGTIYSSESRIFFLKMSILILLYFKSYLDLYVFFYVKMYVLFIFIPVFIIISCTLSPLWEHFVTEICSRERHYGSVRSECSLPEQKRLYIVVAQ